MRKGQIAQLGDPIDVYDDPPTASSAGSSARRR